MRVSETVRSIDHQSISLVMLTFPESGEVSYSLFVSANKKVGFEGDNDFNKTNNDYGSTIGR